MITYIEGRLAEKTPTYAIIECNGIGYFLNISLNTYSSLGEINQVCRLFTHLAIKNEATTPVGLTLYGFHNAREREVFLHLISVSGVGANTARLIISSLTADDVVAAVVNGNVGLFQSVKGIGGKTAQKIIIDLRDKIGKTSSLPDILNLSHNTNREEALSALILLGFSRNPAEKALDRILKTEPSLGVEQLIKQALKIL
jgi:Holliday junction DNA helicase RuvA